MQRVLPCKWLRCRAWKPPRMPLDWILMSSLSHHMQSKAPVIFKIIPGVPLPSSSISFQGHKRFARCRAPLPESVLHVRDYLKTTEVMNNAASNNLRDLTQKRDWLVGSIYSVDSYTFPEFGILSLKSCFWVNRGLFSPIALILHRITTLSEATIVIWDSPIVSYPSLLFLMALPYLPLLLRRCHRAQRGSFAKAFSTKPSKSASRGAGHSPVGRFRRAHISRSDKELFR